MPDRAAPRAGAVLVGGAVALGLVVLLVVGDWRLAFVAAMVAFPSGALALVVRAYLRRSAVAPGPAGRTVGDGGSRAAREQGFTAGPGDGPVAAPADGRADEPGVTTAGWRAAADRFGAVAAAYAAFECDPLAVLRTPALVDASVPATARFVDAFAEAQALATDGWPGAAHATLFTAAAEHAERAWEAARDVAARLRLASIPEAERRSVERVIALLTTARDTANEHERHAAYARARGELSRLDRIGVLRLPRPARAELAGAARAALPAPGGGADG